MKNDIAKGETMTITTTAAHSAGDVVVINNVVGIAADDALISTTAILKMQGVAEVPKVTGAINQGQFVYWDADGNPLGGISGDGAATTTSTDNTKMGYAYEAAAADATTVKVKLQN